MGFEIVVIVFLFILVFEVIDIGRTLHRIVDRIVPEED